MAKYHNVLLPYFQQSIKPLLLLVCTIISFGLNAQVGGISGGKINALNHNPIPKGDAEFEPNYSISLTKQYWDKNGNLQSLYNTLDSVLIETSVSFRMAYAFTDQLEIGTFIANNFSNWSVKYSILTQNKIGLGFFGWV